MSEYKKQKKYIVVTGGVISGLGKGITGASIGFFFSEDYKVVPIKLDGYLNVDPGTMNPHEHGEVFVLDDGAEVDMDFGHYERYLNTTCYKSQSITMGKVYKNIRVKERRGDYLGKTVQLIPHVTNMIQDKILKVAENQDAEIVLVEIGGTIGDLENELFVEGLRQLEKKVGHENICYVHLSYVPIPFGVDEQKTKPTQQSINLLQSKGIWPDFIVCRCAQMLHEKNREKIALFASLEKEDIFTAIDIDSVYKVPSILNSQNLITRLSKRLGLEIKSDKRNKKWTELLLNEKNKEITITIAGKYMDLEDSYASVVESLKHCELNFGVKINIDWLDTSKEINYEILAKTDGVIVPGGFGNRGIEGKINVIKFVRENKIPYLGICYGLQLAVIEFLRDVCGVPDATSMELDENTKSPAVILMDEQKNIVKMGGTMRLGSYDAELKDDSLIYSYYNQLGLANVDRIVSERHRHRFEVNPEYAKIAEDNGLIVSGKNPDRDLVEFIELNTDVHPYFVATQAHPELKSCVEKPAPLFYGLVENALKRKNK